MIGVKPIPHDLAINYLYHFYAEFDSPDKRRQTASKLIEPAGNNDAGPQAQFVSRLALSAFWGDEPRDLLKVAKGLYDVANTAQNFSGRTSIGFVTGTASGLATGDIPPGGIGINVDTLSADHELSYGFRPTPKRHVYPEFIGAKFLDMQVNLAAQTSQSVSLDADRNLSVSPAINTDCGSLAFSGTVCIEANRNIYRQTRQHNTHEIVFGSRQGFRVISQMVELAGGQAQERFGNMVAEGIISPLRPLPDLEPLAS